MWTSFAIKPRLLTTGLLLSITFFYAALSWHLRGPLFVSFNRLNSHNSHRDALTSATYAIHLQDRWSTGLSDIFNETLGFQQISMISLPERTDRQDAFALAASLAGFSYCTEPGVHGTDVPARALPYTMNQHPGVVGCWRAHLNVWEKMLREGIESALVFEDDADWDIGLRAQLLEFAKGTRFVTESETEGPHSPYGDDWDVLWFGHCATAPAPWNDRRWVIPSDPTVVPLRHALYMAGDGPANISRYESEGKSPVRVIAQAYGAVCTASYAISRRGAQKALFKLSVQPYNAPVDLGLKDLCRNRSYGFKCVAPYPQIVGVYRQAGYYSSHSDISPVDSSNDGVAETGHSESVAFSVKNNLERLLEGSTSYKNTYWDALAQELTLKQITAAVGYGEIAPPSEFAGLTDGELEIELDWPDLLL